MRLSRVRRALRGEVKLTTAAREVLRRTHAAALHRRERATLDQERELELKRPFSEMSSADLLDHFRTKRSIDLFLDLALNPPPLTRASESHDVTEWRRDPLS